MIWLLYPEALESWRDFHNSRQKISIIFPRRAL